MRKQIFLGLFLLLSFLCGVVSAATVYQNESQLIQTSDLIVYGKIVEVKSAWNSQNTHIETTAQVLVNDTLKNSGPSVISPGSTIGVTELGGTIGNITEEVEDTPIFMTNTEAVFFLKKMDDKPYYLIKLYEVTNGNIGESTSPGTSNNIAAYKQKIATLMQGNSTSPTTTTKKAGLLYAPLMVIIGILLFFRKIERQ